jgi:8-oxo-dGTP pyrophosphatase MutT (NUDIX family)
MDTKDVQPLPNVPRIDVDVVGESSEHSASRFFNVRRMQLRLRYPDGSESASFQYDVGARTLMDGVIILPTFVRTGTRHVFLRSAVRPPCALRPIPPKLDGGLWELPAGFMEPGEDPVEAVQRELMEEVGFKASPEQIAPLGEWTLAAPAIIGERHLFYVVHVDPTQQTRPSEDGSALERHAAIVSLPVADALEHCRRGAIRDAKTELGLRRLIELPRGSHFRGEPSEPTTDAHTS